MLREKNQLGMALFLLSEVAFFSVLILGYLYYAGEFARGPNAETLLDPLLTGVFTLALISSSVTFWRAQKSAEHGQQGRFRMWLGVTLALGVVFLAGQGWEWAHLFGEGVGISLNLFTTAFFTLTGFHGLHVASGLVAILVLLGLAFSRQVPPGYRHGIAAIELYWHFVDVVWIVIFAIIYLWPLL